MSSTSENISSRTQADPEQWVDLYGNYLYRYALSRLRNPQEAENLVQETFLAALSARENFSGKSTERTWMIGILKHKIIDYFRKQYREQPVTDLAENEQAINSFFDHNQHLKKKPSGWIPEPGELLESKEFWQIVNDCLNKLPKTAHDVFYLKELEKVDSKEICETLQISDSNYWVIMHRARLQLRECLEMNWFEKSV